MELKLLMDIEDVENIREKHAVIIVSDGKMQFAELPQFGKVQINCSGGVVKQVDQNTGVKF